MQPCDLVAFTIARRRLALPLRQVERVVRIVEVLPLPESSPFILGAVNVGGKLIPVLNLRPWLGAEDREVALEDVLILIRSAEEESCAIWADRVTGLISASDVSEVESPPALSEGQGEVFRDAEGMILVPDWTAWLPSAKDVRRNP